jgi:hypothetical protein
MPAAAGPSSAGSADAGESRRATAHRDRRESIVAQEREACMVVVCYASLC